MSATSNNDEKWALFLDVDGTLLTIAETPLGVQIPDSLRTLLHELRTRFEGALALISGRSIDTLDHFFDPLRLCASGVHGCERRTFTGELIRPDIAARSILEARNDLTGFVRDREGLLLEDKGYGLAVHFRLAPSMDEEVHEKMSITLKRLGPDFRLQAGKFVYEIRPAHWSKGTSVAAFMQEAPFHGRRPIYIGDDVTDEDAFTAVNELDGVSIRVGDAANTVANHRLADVAAVHRWLQTIPPPALPVRST